MLMINGYYRGAGTSHYKDYTGYNGIQSQPNYSNYSHTNGYTYVTLGYNQNDMASYGAMTLTFKYDSSGTAVSISSPLVVTKVLNNLEVYLCQYIDSSVSGGGGYKWCDANSKYFSSDYTPTGINDIPILTNWSINNYTVTLDLVLATTGNVNNNFYIRIGSDANISIKDISVSF